MGQFKATPGAIVKPLGFPTKMVPTKPGEVQPIGNLVVYDTVNRYYANPAASATNGRFAVVANTNLNGTYDGQREVVIGNGQEVMVNVRAGGTIIPGTEVVFSATPGRVDAATGPDAGTQRVCGRFEFKALEFWKDGIQNPYTNAAAGDIVTILLYAPTR